MTSKAASRRIREIILAQSMRAKVGHIGSALSIADIMAVLYTDILNIPSPEDPERDRFVLSKGHAALALYAALAVKGWIPEEELDTFCGDNSRLGVHPEGGLPGVDFATGSLGQGLSMATGAALAARMQGSPRRVFAIVSDAECNEGSIWEAIMFAAHQRLANLVAILDLNGQQALGFTEDVISLTPMVDRIRAFGWNAYEVDGHDIAGLKETFSSFNTRDGRPHFVIARTTFGKGVSYMENQIKWHYWPMSDAEYQQAREEMEAIV